jgi:hypothetical protein
MKLRLQTLRFGLIASCFFLPSVSNAQITFERTYGDTANDSGSSVQQTVPDGGYIIAGYSYSFGASNSDIYLIKTDSLGDTLWTRTYGGPQDDGAYSIRQTSDGGYIVVGSTESFGLGPEDVYLVKTDSLGDTLWTKTYGGTSWDLGLSVQQTLDGGFIIVGDTYLGPGVGNVYLIKTDIQGDTLWTKNYGGNQIDRGRSVQQTSDKGYIIAGITESFGAGTYDVYIIKTDTLGDTLWTKTYGSAGEDHGNSVQQTSDGGFIVSGTIRGDVYLIKTDSLGDTLWTKTYGGNKLDIGSSVQQTSVKGYIIAGMTESFGAGNWDVYMIKTDSLGDTLWTKTYGGAEYEWGYSVQQTVPDGGYIITGGTNSFGAGLRDVYLIKTDSLGNVLVGVEEEPDSDGFRIAEFRLLQNYPNPFQHSTVIRYQIPSVYQVTLTVYDITGRLVEILVDEHQEPGIYHIQWDSRTGVSPVRSGIYFYRLQSRIGQAGNYTETKKLILLK